MTVDEVASSDVASPPMQSRWGLRFLAVAGSLAQPGLGHLLIGQTKRARGWFIAWLLLVVITTGSLFFPLLVPIWIVLFPATLVMGLCLWIDAYRSAGRATSPIIRSPLARYAVGAACLTLAFYPAHWLFVSALIRDRVAETFLIPDPSKTNPEFFDAARIAKTGRGAMAPTLEWGDRYIVHKHLPLQRWSIVAVEVGDPRAPGAKYTERVVGFPGETIELFNGGVRVNGQLLQPPSGVKAYVSTVAPVPGARSLTLSNGKLANGIEGNPIKLGPDEYFFLGDNSPIAGDSRFWDWSVDGHQPGTLPRSHIKGVATWVYWPIGRWRKLY